MPTETVFIESLDDKARIETRITYNANAENPPSIVIAHPYGPLGGNFNNNVVVALHRYFSNKGYVAASLNFRGCGNSERRTSWTGMPERGDYHAVMNYVMDRFRPSRLVIGGYSFGSMIASSMPPPTNIPYSYLLISYPLSVQWALATFKSSYFTQQFTQVLSSGKALFIYGDSDQFTGVRSYQKLKFTAPSKAVMIPGADHFWFGYEDELKAALDAHFQ